MLRATGFDPIESTTANPFHTTIVARAVPDGALSS
jgi:hypothetical protein